MVKNVLTLKFDLSVFCFSKFISRDLTNEVRVYFKVMICIAFQFSSKYFCFPSCLSYEQAYLKINKSCIATFHS